MADLLRAAGFARPAVLAVVVLAGCAETPRATVAVGRPLAGQAEDGRPATLPAGVRVVSGAAPQVRAFAIHGLIRPSLVLSGSTSLRVAVPVGASALRFSVAVRPLERAARLRIANAARPRVPLFEETFQGERGWLDRQVPLAPRPSEIVVEVDTRAETVALGELRFETEAEARHPSVLLYVVDCLRAGYLGAWGHEGKASPAIDALAQGGVRFMNTASCAGWTKPSTGCLFTSLYPNRHGARTVDDALEPGPMTLAQRFQGAGYATAAFVANPVLDHQWFGFGRGFDLYQALGLRYRGRGVNAFNTDAADLTDTVLAWMAANRGRRSFVYAHALDLHAPYEPHPPFDRVGPDGRASVPQTDEERYLRELAYNDRHFGRLLHGMRQAGTYDGTMIVVTSDHGEEFGEHGSFRHGKSLHDTLLHIPWIVKLPGGRAAGRRVVDPVANLDVGPTLLDLAGLPVPTDVQGTSVAALLDGRPGPPPRTLYAEQMSGIDAVWAARSSGMKLIRRLLPEPEELLYDLRRDPREQENLNAPGGPEVTALRRALDEFMTASLQGLHVRLGGAPPGTRMAVDVDAAAPLGAITRLVIRTGDELVVSDDRRSLRLSFTVDDHGPRHVVVRTAGPGGTLTVSARAGAVVLAPAAVGLGPEPTRPPSVPFEVHTASLGPLSANVPREAFLQVGHVHGPAPEGSRALDPQLVEHLRALGYVQ